MLIRIRIRNLNADPDLATQINPDPCESECGSGSATLSVRNCPVQLSPKLQIKIMTEGVENAHFSEVSELTCGEGCVERVAASHQAGGGLSRAFQQQYREHGVLNREVGVRLFSLTVPFHPFLGVIGKWGGEMAFSSFIWSMAIN